MRTEEAIGSVTAVTEHGVVNATWGPGGSAATYAVSKDEEADLRDLTAALANAREWLPAEAWIDPSERIMRPDHWLIYLVLRPSGHGPGDVVELPSGNVLEGTDDRLALIALPGDAAPINFGVEVPAARVFGEDSTVRCARATAEEAVALQASLDSVDNGVGLGTDGHGEVFTEDLRTSVAFNGQPVYGSSYDCAALASTWELITAPSPSATPAPVRGDLGSFDPCTLVGDEAMSIAGADERQVIRSRIPLGGPANACVVSDSSVVSDIPPEAADPLPPGYRVIVTLYPQRITSSAARDVVESVFGIGVVEEALPGGPAWSTACEPRFGGATCNPVTAAWTSSRLLFFEFTDAADPSMEPLIRPDRARAFIEQVLQME